MALPNLLLPDWGNAGEKLSDAFVYRSQQNALAAALPGALSGDANSLAALYKANPRLGVQVQNSLDEKAWRTQQTDLASRKEREGLARQGLTDAAGMIVNMPETELPTAWGGIRTGLVTQYPELAPHLPEQYTPQVLATARGLAGVKPATPKGPTDDITEFEFAKQNGFGGSFEQWMARKAQQSGGGSPFFQFLPGADGYLVGNARTGQIAPGMVNGQRAIPGALDPRLQGSLAQAKEEGQGRGEISTDKTKKVVAANSTIGLLDEADKLINSATGSKVGNVLDASQAAFGKSNEGAEAIARLRVISAGLTANVPRMEGPQSDADRLMYQQAAGDLGNPTVPAPQKAAAAATIRHLSEKYISLNSGGGQAPNTPPNSGGSTVLDWNDLP